MFHFIWNHGIGNSVDHNEDPTPWTLDSLQMAFDVHGKSISKRTIQHWRSGRYLPSRRNMHFLARIISHDNPDLKREWADALISSLKYKPAPSKPSEDIDQTHNKKTHLSNDHQSPFKNRSGWFLAGAALFLATLMAAAFVNITRPKLANVPPSLAIMTIENLTPDIDLNYLTQGLTENLFTAFIQVPRLKLPSRRMIRSLETNEPSLRDIQTHLGVRYTLEGDLQEYDKRRILAVKLTDISEQILLWNKSYDMEAWTFLDVQNNIINEVAATINLDIPTPAGGIISRYGTDNAEAFSHYTKARHLLKYWHETRNGASIWDANEAFDKALKLDPKMGIAAFHKADAYYHYAVGDDIAPSETLQTFTPTSQQEALEAIQSMMAQARQNASTPFDAAQAKINEIYFSEDWKLLRDSAINYSDLAIDGRGELEWFFEPVILLFLNEEQALQDLIQNRILKYDPLNGTGHAYSVRQYLISGQYGKAHDRLKQAEVATFSSRIAEVKGYLLIAEGDGLGLSQHLENIDIISPLHRDYFQAISQYFKGDVEGARKTLLSSDALISERIHQALGLHHIGDKSAAQSQLNEIASEQMGRLLLTISLSYGAACGDRSLPPIDKLDQLMMKFNIETLPCIGSQ